MIAARCPHEGAWPRPGELCPRCGAAGAAIVRLAPSLVSGGCVFESSPARGLSTGEMRALLGQPAADEALVERKLQEGGDDPGASTPFDEDPALAEREAYEEALAWELNLKLSRAVGEDFGPAVLLVIPGASPSWAGELLRADDAELRRVLLSQKTAAWGPRPRYPSGALMMVFHTEAVGEALDEVSGDG